VDGSNPAGNGLVLPAGPLREPMSGARRADAFWVTGDEKERLSALLTAAPGGKPVVRARTVPGGLVTGAGGEAVQKSPAGTRVFAFCGIARPGRFFETVGRTGAATVGHTAFPDHHRYTSDDVALLNRRARDAGAQLMLTTEKDLARLPADAPFTLPVAALAVDLAVAGDDALIEMIQARLKEKTR
jgi:tetraacyldisaccharide 4'-kinase